MGSAFMEQAPREQGWEARWWWESKVGQRLRGLQRGSPQGFLPEDRLSVHAQRTAGRAEHESPEEPAGQRVCKWARRVEGGASQENCGKRRWGSPRTRAGSVIPAFLTCVLTVFCADANQNLRVGKAELFPE